LTHHAEVAWHKEQGRDNVALRTQKGRTDKKRRWKVLEYNYRIRNRGLKEQLRLRSERSSGRIFRKALVLEIVK
jgi:hypothetical protein